MALQTFEQSYYLSQNPDVLNAVLSGQFTSAEQHYILFGEKEGRMPNAHFDAAGYLSLNPDVFAAVQSGVFSTGLEHYEMYGAAEDRNPGSLEFNETFYLAENPDVAAAVAAGTFSTGWQHYILYGANEGRSPASGVSPGTPGEEQIFTVAVGEALTGTAGDDVFRGVLDLDRTAGGDNGTINIGDAANGLSGTDTLDLITAVVGAGVTTPGLPGGNSFSEIEIVNITQTAGTLFAGAGSIDADDFSDPEQLWQIGAFSNVIDLDGTVAGFRGNVGLGNTVTVANAVTAASVALDGVATGSTVGFAEASANDLESITVTGTVTTAGGANALTIITGAANISDLTLGINSGTTITLAGTMLGTAETITATNSAGNFTMDTTGVVNLGTYAGGSGGETLTVDIDDVDRAIATEAGNDTVNYNGFGGAGIVNHALTIALGAGSDTFALTAAAAANSNIRDADEADFQAGLVSVTDFALTNDSLDLRNPGNYAALSSTQLANIDGAASLFAAVGIAAGIVPVGANNMTAFGWGGNTYVYTDNGGVGFDNGDGLIEIAGVSFADMNASPNFLV